MPRNDLQPEMWTLGGLGGIISAGAVAALCVGFLVVCLFRHLPWQAMAFGGFGAVVMIVMALGQWRGMKQRTGGRGR